LASLSIIFAGSGEFGAPTLRELAKSRHRLSLVVSQPDKPAGRGKTPAPTPISRLAIEHGLPLLRTADINNETLPEADLMIVVAFGQKISQRLVKHPRLGSVNLHASLLPKYRGAAPINWTIIRGESITGNSIIRLAERMDAGAILAQSRLAVGELETAGELHDRLAEDGRALMLRVVETLADGAAVEMPQDECKATLAPKLRREDARLDFSRPADELARHIRGLYPWPGCHVRIIDPGGRPGGNVTLARARAVASGGASPGTMTAAGTVAAGDGNALEIIELQPEGKRCMTLAAYRNGHPWESGSRLESI